jgi:predicted HTH transcriptional regulator
MENLEALVLNLIELPAETEWIEFKKNNAKPEDIGKYISALSNSATYHEKDTAYLLWGIDNEDHTIVGTTFNYHSHKVRGQELESWLRQYLSKNADFYFSDIIIEDKKVVLCTISKATFATVKFSGEEFIRIGTYTKKLKDFPSI